MNFLATFLVALCLSTPGAIPAPQPVSRHIPMAKSQPKGIWYLADTGHAVYCFGPVRLMQQADGGIVRVATFCKGDQIMVPLRD